MDAGGFDALARILAAGATRRGIVRLLAAFPVTGALSTLLGNESEARRRRRRRKARHDPGQDKDQRKGKRKSKKCKAESPSQTCAGNCGPVKNNCGKMVGCAPCDCQPPCIACSVDNPCPNDNQLCISGECQACDVCESGCTFGSVQEAIDDAGTQDGDTIYICAGTYGRITIGQSLTLIGAGPEPGNTVLDGEASGIVVSIADGLTVSLAGMRITNGFAGGDNVGGGVQSEAASLTMTDCDITDNIAVSAGGIINSGGTLTMTGCNIAGNKAPDSNGLGGGLVNDGGTVTMTDCTVSENVAFDLGGGILNLAGTITLSGTRVTQNGMENGMAVTQKGGGIYISADSTVTLENGSQVVQNGASDASPAGGGIFNDGIVAILSGSEVASNTPDDCVNGLDGSGCPTS